MSHGITYVFSKYRLYGNDKSYSPKIHNLGPSSPRQGAKGLEDSWTDADVQATLIGQRSLCMVSVKDGSRATQALSSEEGKQVGYTFPLGLLTIARYCPL